MGTSTFLREEMELREGVDQANEEGDEGRGARKRRHSPTAMNAWYNELGGRNKDPDEGVGSVAAKVRKGEGKEIGVRKMQEIESRNRKSRIKRERGRG